MQAEYASAKMALDAIEDYVEFIGDNHTEITSSSEMVAFIKKIIEINVSAQLKMEEIDGRK